MRTLFATSILLGFLTDLAHAGDACPNCAGNSCCATVETNMGQISGISVYQLRGDWTNDLGQSASLISQKGHVQVVTMFFAHCSYACPLLVYKMKQVEAALPLDVRSNVAFTLVSFDSDRDTPSVLHEYRESHQLGTNWTLLHGTTDDVLELSAALDVKFKKDSGGQFQHSNLITVLNPEGEISCQETGLDLNSNTLVREIEALLKGAKHAANN